MKPVKFAGIFLLVAVVGLTRCDNDDDNNNNPQPQPGPTIYENLGGDVMVADPANTGEMIEQGYLNIRSVVDSSLLVIAGDDQLESYFAVLLDELDSGDQTGLAMLSENLSDFFASAAGSENIEYEGLSMVEAHDPNVNNRMTGFISPEDFDQFVQDVGTGAQQNDVSEENIGDLVDLMNSVKDQIVMPSLYEQLGGGEMVEDPVNEGEMIEQGYLNLRSVVDSSLLVIAADEELQPYFAVLLDELSNEDQTGFAMLSENLSDFFAMATGAENIEYEGLGMVEAHDPNQNPRMTGMVSDEDFDQFMADVGTGAQQNGVSQDMINNLVDVMESVREPVVQQ